MTPPSVNPKLCEHVQTAVLCVMCLVIVACIVGTIIFNNFVK